MIRLQNTMKSRSAPNLFDINMIAIILKKKKKNNNNNNNNNNYEIGATGCQSGRVVQ